MLFMYYLYVLEFYIIYLINLVTYLFSDLFIFFTIFKIFYFSSLKGYFIQEGTAESFTVLNVQYMWRVTVLNNCDFIIGGKK